MIEFIPDPTANKIRARITARGHVISQSNLQLLASYVDDTVSDLVANPDKRIATILQNQQHRKPALSAPASELISEDLLHSSFLRNVQTFPDRIAVRYLDDIRTVCCLTYQELKVKVDSFSAALQGLGMPRATSVVVMTSKTPDLFITFLAILQVGLIYAPLSADTPDERLEYILSELSPGCVLVDDPAIEMKLRAKFPAVPEISVIQTLAKSGSSFEPVPSGPNDMAYIIYTSGSTGRPKAVMVSHSAAVATIKSSRNILDLESDSRWLQFAPLTFDMSIYDMSVAFSCGICLCAAPRSSLLDDLPGVIQELEVTHLDLTPSVARNLDPKAIPTVKILFCIGERLSQSIIDRWGSKCLNVYGPTEAAMACTSHRIRTGSIPANIGRKFAHAQCAIFAQDSDLPIEMLAPGELCIAGPQLSRGYLYDEAKTNASFFHFNGTRFYRTGDLCRMLSDESILYLDRKDNQVKLRGQRLELDEIDSVLSNSFSNLESTTLVLRSAQNGLDQLVSFVAQKGIAERKECQLSENIDIASGTIVEELSKYLPNYMVPAHIIHINFVPLSAAHKIDRRRLFVLWEQYCLMQLDAAEETDTRLLTHAEQVIVETFAEISGVKISSIKRKTSIYHLGLDSISAIQIVAALRKKKIEVSVLDVLRNPTVENLSALLKVESVARTPKIDETELAIANARFADLHIRLTKGQPGPVYPCTPPQENMIAQFISSEGRFYYNHVLLKLEPQVAVSLLKTAWIKTVEAHEILRCGFIAVDTKDCQYALLAHQIDPSSAFWEDKHVLDFTTEVDALVMTLTQSLLKDISRPSLHLSHLETATDHYLLFSAHHAIYDGHSLDQIFSEVSARYNNKSIDACESTKESAQKIWSLYNEKVSQDQTKDFWHAQMANSEVTPFPNLNNRDEKGSGAAVQLSSHKHCLSELETKCRLLGVSLPNVALTVWAKILSAYTGENRVTFGVVLSGRLNADLDRALYPCVTTVPFTCDLTGSAIEAVREVSNLSNQFLEFQHISLGTLAREDKSSLFDTLFVYQTKSIEVQHDLWHVDRDMSDVEVSQSKKGISDILIQVRCQFP